MQMVHTGHTRKLISVHASINFLLLMFHCYFISSEQNNKTVPMTMICREQYYNGQQRVCLLPMTLNCDEYL